MSVTDINERRQRGDLPTDPSVEAVPVSRVAREQAEDEARLKTYRTLLSGAHERAITPKTAENQITTGHWEVDRDTGGFRPGFVWVFGAKSHWGKSSSLVMFADENIKRGKRVLIVSAEDPDALYADRLLMRRARVNRYRFSEGRLTPEEHRTVAEVVSRGEDVPVFLDAIGKSVEWAAKRVKKIIQAEGIDLVAWDYLHAFQKEKSFSETRQGLNYIARVMTDTTKNANVAGVIYGQVTPDTKATVPDMYEIRDSKDVVNAAEVVAIGYQPSDKVERDVDGQRVVVAEAGTRAIVIAKNKPGPGPAGRVYEMGSDKECGCFDVVRNEELERYQKMADEALGPMDEPDWRDQ